MANRKGGKHAASPSAGADKVGGNEDLVREILLRLPVRSLLIFKSVSKQWFNLISDPRFTLDHTSRTNPSSLLPSAVFMYNSYLKRYNFDFVWLDNHQSSRARARVRVRVPSLSLSFFDCFFWLQPYLDLASQKGETCIRIFHSCNGLLLCGFHASSSIYDHAQGQLCSRRELYLCVCNPTTKTYTMLPKANINRSEDDVGVSLIFHPLESHHYSVVLAKYVARTGCSIDIYSSEYGLWTTSVCTFNSRIRCSFKRGGGAYCNGIIHWLGYNNNKCCSLQFNVRTSNLTLVELPKKPSSRSKVRYFGECSGRMYLIYVHSMNAKEFEVLEKDRDTSQWYPRYKVHLNRIVSAFPEIVRETGLEIEHLIRNRRGAIQRKEYVFQIMSVVDRGEKEEDLELVLIVPGKVISYNLKRKTSKVLSEFPWNWKELPNQDVFNWCNFDFISVFPYIESLASV
ncbi:hypothetical protein LguiA_018832 [Lonicera macranthoides]